MSETEVPGELVAAYMSTQYRAFTLNGDIVLRIGEPSRAIRRLIQSAGADGAAFLTAENPLGIISTKGTLFTSFTSFPDALYTF